MKEQTQISVLIPVYNTEKSIKQAVWSVLNQSFEDFELIIYLDGCTDDSKNILNTIEDKRIKILENKENKGIVHARNVLVKYQKSMVVLLKIHLF